MAQIQKRILVSGGVRYDVRWRLPDGIVRNKTFRRFGDARDYKRELEHQTMVGVVVDPQRSAMTLEVYANQWLPDHRKVDGSPLAPKTQELYRYVLDQYVIPQIGSLSLGDLRTEGIRRWYRGVAEDASPLQAAKAYRLLKTILNTAVADGRLIVNPCNLKGAGQERSPERPLVDASTVVALADSIAPRYRALVLLAGFGGFRRGELCALYRSDVNILHRTVSVERQLVDLRPGGQIITPPKSSAGVRTVHLPGMVSDTLEEHLAEYVAPEPDALVFTGYSGQPIPRTGLHAPWKAACAAVGVNGVKLHDLRHAAGTLTAQSGATTKELMARLGHASPAAALRYQHAAERRDAEIADRIGAAIAESAGSKAVPLRQTGLQRGDS
jgi:integrase